MLAVVLGVGACAIGREQSSRAVPDEREAVARANERARAVVHELAAHKFSEVHARAARSIRMATSAGELEAMWLALEAKLGALLEATPSTQIDEFGGLGSATRVACRFERGNAAVYVDVDEDGTIQWLRLACEKTADCRGLYELVRPKARARPADP